MLEFLLGYGLGSGRKSRGSYIPKPLIARAEEIETCGYNKLPKFNAPPKPQKDPVRLYTEKELRRAFNAGIIQERLGGCPDDIEFEGLLQTLDNGQ